MLAILFFRAVHKLITVTVTVTNAKAACTICSHFDTLLPGELKIIFDPFYDQTGNRTYKCRQHFSCIALGSGNGHRQMARRGVRDK